MKNFKEMTDQERMDFIQSHLKGDAKTVEEAIDSLEADYLKVEAIKAYIEHGEHIFDKPLKVVELADSVREYEFQKQLAELLPDEWSKTVFMQDITAKHELRQQRIEDVQQRLLDAEKRAFEAQAEIQKLQPIIKDLGIEPQHYQPEPIQDTSILPQTGDMDMASMVAKSVGIAVENQPKEVVVEHQEVEPAFGQPLPQTADINMDLNSIANIPAGVAAQSLSMEQLRAIERGESIAPTQENTNTHTNTL